MLQPSGMTRRGVGTAVSSRASGPLSEGGDGFTNLYSLPLTRLCLDRLCQSIHRNPSVR